MHCNLMLHTRIKRIANVAAILTLLRGTNPSLTTNIFQVPGKRMGRPKLSLHAISNLVYKFSNSLVNALLCLKTMLARNVINVAPPER